MKELLVEIFSSIRKNKLRSVLTGFSIAWGIFMLVILLGSGNGLKNGIMKNFSDMGNNNVIHISGGYTTIPYQGLPHWRKISLTEKEIDLLRTEFDEIEALVLGLDLSNARNIVYDEYFMSSSTKAVSGNYNSVYQINIVAGRFINDRDVQLRRKVIVVDKKAADFLFKTTDPIGQSVELGGIAFTVVGVTDEKVWGSNAKSYVPLSTGSLVYAQGDTYNNISVIGVINEVASRQQLESLENNIRNRISRELRFDPKDRSALSVNNKLLNYLQTQMIFKGISIFVWIIGLGTLTAGIVGVSNIMLVTVRERTFEFGVRKALGARPRSIIRLILFESVMITALFGYLGMLAGVVVMEGVNMILKSAGPSQSSMFVNPTLDIGIAISATIVLVLAGLVAGYLPARRAARLKTIDALRFNK